MFEFFRRQLQTILWYIHGVFTNQLSTEELLRPTVVIAPHQDDEVLGCGGTISHLRQCGVPVTIIFLCSGAYSHSKLMPPEEMEVTRNREALDAAKSLGVAASDVLFMPICTREYPINHEEIKKQLIPVLQNRQADNYYIPYRYEPHPEHSATASIGLYAIDKLQKNALVMEYPVWFWEHQPWMMTTYFSSKGFRRRLTHSVGATARLFLHFNQYVDIAKTLHNKNESLDEYKSQMTKLTGAKNWTTLAEVGSGDFLKCFNRSREIFSKTVFLKSDYK